MFICTYKAIAVLTKVKAKHFSSCHKANNTCNNKSEEQTSMQVQYKQTL